MARLTLAPVGADLDQVLSPDERARHLAHTASLDADLAAKKAEVRAGWGPKAADRVREKGKRTTWERIDRLKDPGAPAFEVGTLVNWGRAFAGSSRQAPGAGVVTCFTRVHDRWVMVIANENTVASGAWWPNTPEKIERAQQMALDLRLPVIYLVDCSGLFLPEQSRSFAGLTGAGHIFQKNAALADAGVPQLAAVFGDCIAGGGYMPIISDRVVMTEGAYMVIAGAALIRGAKSQKLTSLDIGGPEVHVHLSGCADLRVPDDDAAVAQLRAEVAKLPSSAADFYRHGEEPGAPRFAPEELSALFPPDFRQGYEVEQLIARLVDRSLFHEVLPHVGREMITGMARISGLWVGIVANRQGLVEEPGIGRRPGGALYREGIAKISTFVRTCDDDGIPVIWLQDISGFDIGVEAERQGLLGYGSNLIYGNATRRSPIFTVLLRKASGAGYYAMAGLPYQPVIQLSTPLTRLAVMEGRTLAIATFNSKLDDDFEIASTDPAEREAITRGMAETAARIEADMDPVASASRMDTDEIVPLGELRAWLTCLVECAWQATGYRRTKNPRIWGLHEVAVLGARPADPGPVPVVEAIRRGDALAAPTVGVWRPALTPGATVRPGARLGWLVRESQWIEVRAPQGAPGAAATVLAAESWVVFDAALVELGEAVIGEAAAADGVAGGPEGASPVRAATDGTVFTRPSPGAPAFVTLGQRVGPQDTVALVEVMKTFTPIRAGVAGEVVQVDVHDGASVSEGAVLVWIRQG
jgi:acetyl-CoA carboxylase carboxyltransferase component/biotin carboxyl carrier protein